MEESDSKLLDQSAYLQDCPYIDRKTKGKITNKWL